MRVIVVLVIFALALVVTAVLRKERQENFDYRYEQTEKRINELVQDIDEDLDSE